VAGNLQSLEIEDHRLVSAAVADKASAKMWYQRDTVDPFQIRDAAHHRAAVGVDHLDFRVVRNVEVSRGRIKCDVVPILLAAWWRAEVVFFQQMITALGPAGENEASERENNARQNEKAIVGKFHRHLPLNSYPLHSSASRAEVKFGSV